MLINTFHGKQDHTFRKITKFYNRITTRVLINNDRLIVVWCSQCNGDQKRERLERQLKLLPICRKIWLQDKRTFIRITHIMPFKTSKSNSSKFKTFLRP